MLAAGKNCRSFWERMWLNWTISLRCLRTFWRTLAVRLSYRRADMGLGCHEEPREGPSRGNRGGGSRPVTMALFLINVEPTMRLPVGGAVCPVGKCLHHTEVWRRRESHFYSCVQSGWWSSSLRSR